MTDSTFLPPPSPARRWFARLARLGASLVLAMGVSTAILALTSGESGVLDLDASQVAVRLDHLSGEREVLQTPGFHFYLPHLQEIFLFPRDPAQFVMQGEGGNHPGHVPQLRVRSKDGSNFWFDKVTIEYQIVPDLATTVLEDSGPGLGFRRHWLRAFARPVLRDEFGRYVAQEIVDPTIFDQARARGRAELNRLLRAHGLEVVQLSMPKPKFDRTYEMAIEDRKEVEQKVALVGAALPLLAKEREQELARLTQKKDLELAVLEGKLEQALIEERAQDVSKRSAADAYAISRLADGQAARAELLAQAEGLSTAAEVEMEALREGLEALEGGGAAAVREQVIAMLRGVQFELIPYSRDPEPRAVEGLGTSLSVAGGIQ